MRTELLLPALLLIPLLLTGCPTDDGPTPFSTGDDDDAVGDDDDTVEDVEGVLVTGAEGSLEGFVIDAITRAPRVNVPVTELDSEPPLAANTDDRGYFQLTPGNYSPAEVWAGGEGYIETMFATTEEPYRGWGYVPVLETWPRAEGEAWALESFDHPWDPGTAVVILRFHLLAGSPSGFSASIDAPSEVPWVYAEDGSTVQSNTIPVGASEATIVFPAVGHGETGIHINTGSTLECDGPETVFAAGDSFLVVPFLCAVD